MDEPQDAGNDRTEPAMTSSEWSTYYAATRERPPRPLLVRALEFGVSTGEALDLGCGAGNDTRFLLACGFRVVAVDAEEAAIAGLADFEPVRLRAIRARFEDFDFQPSQFDLVNAQLSLPFTTPAAFPAVTAGVVSTLRPSGIFTGQLFGARDGWNVPGSTLTFVSREEAERLFAGLELLLLDETEGEVMLASGKPHHGHAFDIIARKPS